MRDFFREIIEIFKKFLILILNWFLLLWSRFPILALTSDTNYTNLQFPGKNKGIRISFLTLYFGEYVFHFFTFSSEKKEFRLIKYFFLSNLTNFNIDEDSNEFRNKINEYKEHIKNLSSDDLEIEKESLQANIERENARITKSDNKLNFYSAIVLAIISILNWRVIKIFSVSFSPKNFSLQTCSSVLIMYYFFNICVIIIQNVKVRSFQVSSFSDLQCSTEKELYYLQQLYYDWLFTRKKAQLFVSYILQIYDYLKIIIMITIILFIASFIKLQNKAEVYDNKILVTNLCQENISDLYSEDSIKFSELVLDLQKNKYSRVLVLYKENLSEKIQESFNSLDKQQVFYLTDKEITDGIMKIILEE